MRYLIGLAIAATKVANAIVYRPDVDVNNYRISSSTFPMVFPYPDTIAGGQNCAATMIGTRFAITAAHCFVGRGTY